MILVPFCLDFLPVSLATQVTSNRSRVLEMHDEKSIALPFQKRTPPATQLE